MVVLLTGGTAATVPSLIRLVQELPGDRMPPPAVLATFDADALLQAPPGARVVLIEPGTHAEWLNLNRPIVRQRALTLLLWCETSCLDALHKRAPDFLDWISHRVQIAPRLPEYVLTALQACQAQAGFLGVGSAPPPMPPWKPVTIGMGYQYLRDACRQDPVWLSGVESVRDWLTAQLAYTQAGRPYGLVMASPGFIGPDVSWVDAQPLSWRQATAAAAQRGEPQPAIAAALDGLNPGTARRPGGLPPDPRWTRLLAKADTTPDTSTIELALELGLDDIAEVWAAETDQQETPPILRLQAKRALRRNQAREATALVQQAIQQADGDARQVALGQLLYAHILTAQGELDSAASMLTAIVIPAFVSLRDTHSLAMAQGQVADIMMARGELDEALRIRLQEELPVYEMLNDMHSRAVTMQQVAEIQRDRGEGRSALGTLRNTVIPEFKMFGDLRSQAMAQGQVADIMMDQGALDEALRIRLQEELPVYEMLGDMHSRVVTLEQIAEIHIHRGEQGEALQILREEVLPAYQALGDPHAHARVLRTLATITEHLPSL